MNVYVSRNTYRVHQLFFLFVCAFDIRRTGRLLKRMRLFNPFLLPAFTSCSFMLKFIGMYYKIILFKDV